MQFIFTVVEFGVNLHVTEFLLFIGSVPYPCRYEQFPIKWFQVFFNAFYFLYIVCAQHLLCISEADNIKINFISELTLSLKSNRYNKLRTIFAVDLCQMIR